MGNFIHGIEVIEKNEMDTREMKNTTTETFKTS